MTTAMNGVGGINVTQMVTQMMSLEKIPQTLLKNKLGADNDILTAYQSLAATFSTVQSSAQAIVGAGGITPWSLYSATSSSPNVSATADSTAVSGIYNFNVTSVAAAHSVMYSGQMAMTAQASTGTTFGITQGGVTTNVTTTDTSLAGVISAINSTAGLGVKAAAVQTGSGVYQLQLNATNTGVSSQFTVSGLTTGVGTASVLTSGSDASVTVGSSTVTSSSNTFTGVFQGVTFTVGKVESGNSITVGNDTAGMTNQVKTLITSMNTAIGQITSQTAYDPTTSKGGPLLGELLPTQLQDGIQKAILNVAGGGTLANIGIQLDQNGNIVFDATKFASAMAANPTNTQSLITGLAQQVNTLTKGAIDPTIGSITTTIQGNQADITDLNNSIAAWDVRLAQRQTDLQTQFSTLATTLATMQNQQSWLSGQFTTMSQ
ncbi:MAG TPA: flagellar filament capping protein FliD [Candidatus Nanopelagicaceae bacterium]|nr:flagellar filament capping protein FliD [Candidatus Nanopelagicaceae bacterium]